MKIKILYFLLFLLLWYLVFSGLNKLIVKKLSYSIEKRYLHFRMIIVGVLFALITANSAVSSYAILFVDKIINSQFIAPFLNKVLPNRAYELVYIVLCNLGLNFIYAVAFVIILWLTRLFFKRKQKYIEYQHCIGSERVIHFPWRIVNKFYNEETGKLALTSKGFFMGIWVKGMKCVFALIWIAEFAVLYYSILWGKEEWNDKILSISKSVYLLPMLAFFIVEQVQLFLEGPETNDVGTFGTVNIKENMIGDMDTLMYRYREIFSESGVLLYSERGPRNGIDHQGLDSNDLGNQQINDCLEPGILAVIANQLRESGVQQNANYQNAIVSLLNGDSISIRDNSDGEFVIYLCAYLSHFLSQGYSAIIACSNKEEVASLKRVYEATKNSLEGIDSVWTIYEINELSPLNHVGILICTYEELITIDFAKQHEYLSADMICAVIPNSASLMTHDTIRVEKVFSRLKAFPNLGQFVFMAEEDNESLRAKIKQYLPEGEVLSSYSNDLRVPRTNIMIWKEESTYKPQQILGVGNSGSPYLGTAFPLALVAAKFDLPEINIVPFHNRGDEYFFGSARQSNERDIQLYLEKKLELNSIIRYSSTEAMKPQDLKMLVVYDTDYNFFNALWRWFKYAGLNGTIIHVVSPFYMMREYFTANFQRRALLYSNNEYNALLPNDTVLKRTKLAAVLASLADVGMTEYELLSISNKYEWNYTDVAALLQDAILTVRADKEFHNVYEHFQFDEEKFFDEEQSGFIHRIRIKLTDTNMIAQQKAQISLARMSFKNNEYIDIPILRGNLWNYYLPKQIIGFQNSYYTIASIDTENGIVHTKPANPTSIPDYFSVCDYALSSYRVLDNCVDSPVLDCNICEATVSKIIYGYISTNNGNNFSRANRPNVNRINNSNTAYQTVTMENAPVLEINLLRESFSASESGNNVTADRAAVLLCVILNGMFKTLFPETHQNIIAIPDVPIDDDLIDHVMHHAFDFSEEDMIRATVPRINSKVTNRDDRFVRIFIIEFSCIEYGMVKAFYDNLNDILNKAYEYLDWYLASYRIETTTESSEQTGIIQGKYLHFGMDTIPSVFAPDALLLVLRDILGRTEPETVIKPDPAESILATDDSKAICSFCNREIIFAWQLSDGRCMCAHCHDHQKTQKDEIKRLFLETKQMLESHYHIEFRKDINVRFQSADAIRKAAGGLDNGRIVGFYSHDKRQLWIEARGPSVAMESTIIHELTHAWQHDVLPLKELENVFPKDVRDKRVQLLLEGHAVYVELEAMTEKGEAEYAKRLRNGYLNGNDVYSLGYKIVSEYFVGMEIQGSNATSFVRMQKMVDDIINKEASISWPEGY